MSTQRTLRTSVRVDEMDRIEGWTAALGTTKAGMTRAMLRFALENEREFLAKLGEQHGYGPAWVCEHGCVNKATIGVPEGRRDLLLHQRWLEEHECAR